MFVLYHIRVCFAISIVSLPAFICFAYNNANKGNAKQQGECPCCDFKVLNWLKWKYIAMASK